MVEKGVTSRNQGLCGDGSTRTEYDKERKSRQSELEEVGIILKSCRQSFLLLELIPSKRDPLQMISRAWKCTLRAKLL